MIPTSSVDSENKITPMLKQFLEIKDKHPDKLILFRMGDFYETFFDDARIASKVLGITLTARNKKSEDPVPLAGFPYHALDNYLDKLVKKGLKIVICEQTEDPKLAKGLVKRDIIDIITPGSIIDGKLIDKVENNFLASIVYDNDPARIGFSIIDASTADFMVTELTPDQLLNELQRLHPSEIIVADQAALKRLEELALTYKPALTVFDSWYFEQEEANRLLREHFRISSLEGFGIQDKNLAQIAAAVALAYIKSLKTDSLKHINKLKFYSLRNYMQLDETTRRNLELTRSIRFGTRFGSLISVLDQTKTPMGARKLLNWLLNPLLSELDIYSRSNAVKNLMDNFNLTEDLRKILNNIGDLSRIISKVGTMRVNPRDVTALCNYLDTAGNLSEILQKFDDPKIVSLKENIRDYKDIIRLIDSSICENPPLVITEGNIIKNGFNKLLDELREIRSSGKSWIARLEDSERKKTSIPSLKVGYNRVFGYYIEITKTHQEKVPEYYIKKQTLVNADRYISPQLKEYESKVLGAEERIKNLEYEIFNSIRKKLNEKVTLMQDYVEVVSTIDVLANFAYLAYRNNYSQPQFNDTGILEIKDSRHPVIEKILENEKFIPNDVFLNDSDNKIALITGPNMAGKSTYLRQTGLLVILAQIGSFIPASYANLPIFDKVFTRVGASDNLALGQSTFLVEMIETANILNSATPHSLILLDEIGRGTSTFDGLSLAWAIVEYIHNNPELGAKTLFATHYHELTELEHLLYGVKNYNILVKEWNDQVIFLRKIDRGSADQSYGIQVARLAGVPVKVIQRAKQILQNLEEHELSPQGLTAKARKQLASNASQLDIFDAIFDKIDQKNDI
ncbi:MAG: DNA mismatch repair protein MutS, partial [Candidatus Cloacimonetes bacterium]|nr:DNA mismatch repair protein MutS [Candidatus Cloacimonadota bacterium]